MELKDNRSVSCRTVNRSPSTPNSPRLLLSFSPFLNSASLSLYTAKSQSRKTRNARSWRAFTMQRFASQGLEFLPKPSALNFETPEALGPRSETPNIQAQDPTIKPQPEKSSTPGLRLFSLLVVAALLSCGSFSKQAPGVREAWEFCVGILLAPSCAFKPWNSRSLETKMSGRLRV